MQEIRIKLKSPKMSTYEALEAITGSFEEHLGYWNNLVKQWFSK